MQLNEELTTLTSALSCIDEKDWYRARTVGENRIISMMNAITDQRKAVGRALAIYFYNKFVRGNNYLYTVNGRTPLDSFLNTWLRGYVSEAVRNQIINVDAASIYPWVDDDQVLRMMQERNQPAVHLGFFNDVSEELHEKDLTYYVVVREDRNMILTTTGWTDLDTLTKTSNLRLFGTEKKALGYLKACGWDEQELEDAGIFAVKVDFKISPRNKLGFFKEDMKLAESLFLSKDEINNKIKELKDEFPKKFEGASDEDIKNTLKKISIDYLDGCTDLIFKNKEDEETDQYVDVTGNSTDILSQPAYKAIMSKVFEGTVDQWLEDHNLSHKDLVWFEFDPDTQQMLVQFDANNVNQDELEKWYELTPNHVEAQEEDDEELEEAFTRDALTKLEKQLYQKLRDNNVFAEDLWFENYTDENNPNGFESSVADILKLSIKIDGDWKHDHLFCDKLVEDFAATKDWKILGEWEETIEDTGDDSYPAFHYYNIMTPKQTIGFFKEDFINEDNLDETYSEEELDKMVGKTYNQQKIQNIYRRTKYNDSRLFAHTRCVNCGREKRVFLSNLVNDPEKYGSCVCSNTNVESRLDNIQDLYSGQKKLSNNTSGYTGVTYVKTYKGEMYDKWRAYIEVDGKRTYLGDFDSKSAAIRARKKAAEKGLKWYKEHKNEFMKNYRKKSKRYRARKK